MRGRKKGRRRRRKKKREERKERGKREKKRKKEKDFVLGLVVQKSPMPPAFPAAADSSPLEKSAYL